MTDYTFVLNVTMRRDSIQYPKACWKPDCEEKTVFIFNFMDNPFPTCAFHADEFLKVLKETYRIFLNTKRSDAK